MNVIVNTITNAGELMDTCFECGGKLKLVSKTGRLAWFEDDLYEIPVELKISTCIDCGQSFEDDFVKVKVANSFRGQKKTNPGHRLLQLRWVDKSIESMLINTKLHGSKFSVYCQTILLLQFRESILSRGLDTKSKEIKTALHKFLQRKWPDLGVAAYPKGVSLQDELAPFLREFCDVWIHT